MEGTIWEDFLSLGAKLDWKQGQGGKGGVFIGGDALIGSGIGLWGGKGSRWWAGGWWGGEKPPWFGDYRCGGEGATVEVVLAGVDCLTQVL